METKAPTGAIWVCPACGKTTSDRYGQSEDTMHGWDVSCSMHSVLCRDDESLVRDEKTSRVTKAEPYEEVKA